MKKYKDLEVKFNTGAIPDRIADRVAGDSPVVQLSLTHEGEFGFQASLTFNIGAENAGKFGNLYYYDSDGRMVYMGTDAIPADGNVTFNFSHASDYMVVISDKEMSQKDVPEDLQPKEAEGTGSDSGTTSDVAETGDSTSVIPVALLMVLAAGAAAACIVLRRRSGR